MTIHVILDLDETCISSADVLEKIPETNKSLESFQLFYSGILNNLVYKRPHLDKFLEICFLKGNVSFWSAGEKEYVLDIVDHIVPNKFKNKISLILWRDHCIKSNKDTKTLKSVQWLKEKIPCLTTALGEDVVLIDDLEENVVFNGSLGFIVPTFSHRNPSAYMDDVFKKLGDVVQSYN